jgi:Flp pilus assembly protein TadG
MYSEIRISSKVPNRFRFLRKRNRRGVTLVFALFLMTTMAGMLALSIDIGYLAMSKSEMRRTADSAALAGGWQLLDSKIRGESSQQATASMRTAASQVALQNSVSTNNWGAN